MNSARLPLWHTVRYAALLVGGATSAVWSGLYGNMLDELRVERVWGYGLPLGALTALIVAPDIWRVGRGLYLATTKKFDFTRLLEVVEGSVGYLGRALFYIDGADQDLYQVVCASRWKRVSHNMKRFLFREYPVVYYNVTAKPFLNWIDFLYLRLLHTLRQRLGARIIIALHFDERVYREGFFRDQVRDEYRRLYERAERIVRMVVGSDTTVIDERVFLQRHKAGWTSFPEYFFGVLISKLNEYAKRLAEGSLEYQRFYRIETNLISILPTTLLAQRYGHLFVLDYEGSFDVWRESPFSEFKREYDILFVKCRKIQGPRGEQIPAWSESDGVNITDETHMIRQKLGDASEVVTGAMHDTLIGNGQSLSPDAKKQALFEEFRRLKRELEL